MADSRRLRRTKEPVGYTLDGEQHVGFPDDPALDEPLRRRIAAWAKALTPEQLTADQRRLLESTPDRAGNEVRERAEQLGGYQGSPYWALLDEPQRLLVREPARHEGLPDELRYPLRIGQLATLVGGDHDRLRYWTNIGLLPAVRADNDYRYYFQEAVTRAFVFETMTPPEITVLREVKEQRGFALLAGMAAILHEHAEMAAGESHEVLERAADGLSRATATLATGRYQRKAATSGRYQRTAATTGHRSAATRSR
jgi:DNA-binding transcriptional MerR regulator